MQTMKPARRTSSRSKTVQPLRSKTASWSTVWCPTCSDTLFPKQEISCFGDPQFQTHHRLHGADGSRPGGRPASSNLSSCNCIVGLGQSDLSTDREDPAAAPASPVLHRTQCTGKPWGPTHHCGEAPGATSAGIRATARCRSGWFGWMAGRDEPAFVSDHAAVNAAVQGEHLLTRVPLVERIHLELVVAVELGRYVHLGR